MTAPWWTYVLAVLIALPAYILWAVGAYGLFRAVLSWVFLVDPPRPAPPRINVRG